MADIPCRCKRCDRPADGEDGKCDVCRRLPHMKEKCVFYTDEEYREILRDALVRT